ncbi:MAG: hypothetical protein JW839_00305 [Candidatus Lokiarchaeota archaeon]|nr:hypothetical protein [Candidatus Lokiarchaeota archaeon]
MENEIGEIYHLLLNEYGNQGWWPLSRYYSAGALPPTVPTGYHEGDYRPPEGDEDVLEVIVGAILAQNVSWIGVEKAIRAIKRRNGFSMASLRSIPDAEMQDLIYTTRFYREKAKRIRDALDAISSAGLSRLHERPAEGLREFFLSIKGIGRETADSIVLYAFKKPLFVVDAYTRRLFSRLGLVDKSEDYDAIQAFFQGSVARDHETYNEYHALVVAHCVRACKKADPRCGACVLRKRCKY